MSIKGLGLSSVRALAACLTLSLFASAPAAAETPPKKSESRPRIAVLGDSLATSAGRASYPTVLQRWLDEHGYDYEVVNAGRGGDTTAGGLRRLEKALEGNVTVLVVELGGNDGLRGVPVGEIKRNLTAIVERAQARGVTVLVTQMETSPSRGWDYATAFHNLFEEVAAERGVALIPFVLAEVFGRSEYTTDGIHPNAAGAKKIAKVIWSALEPELARRQGVRPK
jgi:acyl-CoA thioesterase-1